ncbi:MAG: ParB/RepB/Spo0J family partition protein [Acetobacteraceae bacterium]|nr:ParB/RepB/Spo0J family partition protein [Acetobacteraceae bacterium]
MSVRLKRPSPVLRTASAMIGMASDTLVTKASRFKHTFEADVAAIRPDPKQARQVFSDAEIGSLAATMEEHGQLQPILLRPADSAKREWIIVAGERRWRAAQLKGWPKILAIEHDGDPEVVSLLENLQRVDLTPVEEARGLQSLINGKGWSQDQAAEVLGKTKSDVSGILRILTLPGDVLDAVQTSELEVSKSVLMELARIERPEVRDQLIRLAKEGRLTIRAIRAAREASQNLGGGRASGDSTGASKRRWARVSLKAVDKIAVAIRGVREAGVALAPKQRVSLEALRAEIDRLLAGVAGES